MTNPNATYITCDEVVEHIAGRLLHAIKYDPHLRGGSETSALLGLAHAVFQRLIELEGHGNPAFRYLPHDTTCGYQDALPLHEEHLQRALVSLALRPYWAPPA